MKRKDWMFLSNHGSVFVYISKNPRSTAEAIARKLNLSMRGVQNILTDLDDAGYVEKVKEGRSNYYIIHSELPMRNHLHRGHTVGDILQALGCGEPKKQASIKQILNDKSTEIRLRVG